MNKVFDERLCAGCAHLVLKGVACDWRPGECPYLQAQKKTETHASSRAVYINAFAANDEFDAIRSVD